MVLVCKDEKLYRSASSLGPSEPTFCLFHSAKMTSVELTLVYRGGSHLQGHDFRNLREAKSASGLDKIPSVTTFSLFNLSTYQSPETSWGLHQSTIGLLVADIMK